MSMLNELSKKRDSHRVQIRRKSHKQAFSMRRQQMLLAKTPPPSPIQIAPSQITQLLNKEQPFTIKDLQRIEQLLQHCFDMIMGLLDRDGRKIADIALENFHLRQGAMIIAHLAEDSPTKSYLISRNTLQKCICQIKSNSDKKRILEYMFVLQRLTADIVETNPTSFRQVSAECQTLLQKGGNTKQFQLLISHLSNCKQLLPKTEFVIKSVLEATVGRDKIKRIAACATVTRVISLFTAAELIPYYRELVEACRVMMQLRGNHFFYEKGKKSLATLVDKVGEEAAQEISQSGLMREIARGVQDQQEESRVFSLRLMKVFVENYDDLALEIDEHMYILQCASEICVSSFHPELLIEALRVFQAILEGEIKTSGAIVRLMCSHNYDSILCKLCSHYNEQVSEFANLLYNKYFNSYEK